MASYPKLQKKLNSNAAFRRKFLSNPAEAMRAEGIDVTPAREKALKAFVARAHKAAGRAPKNISVNAGIAISVRF
ncbi:hypothetical protein MXD81_39275 [Microbacteriaceae bacterium K1510]|nr:hypothetical protein [Microbacteriaceae bacterium K1510]